MAIRAAIPDATTVHVKITKRTKGHGVRKQPWALWIAANHPARGNFGATTTSIVNSIGFGGCSYETPEKAIDAAEGVTSAWLKQQAKEAQMRSREHMRTAAEHTRKAAEELAESDRLRAVLAGFDEHPVESTDGVSTQSTTVQP